MLRAKYLGTVVAIKQLDNDVKRCMNKVDLDKYIARERAMTFFAHPHLVQVGNRVGIVLKASWTRS